MKGLNLHVIALLEPRISGEQTDKTIKRIGLPYFHRVEATVFWRDMAFAG